MSKREQLFQQIERVKKRYKNIPTEQILDKLNNVRYALTKAGRMALNQILEEREHEALPIPEKEYPIDG